MTKLPADLLTDGVLWVGSGETSCLGGIRRGTQGVCAHMENRRGLPRGSGGCCCCGSVHVLSGAATDKSAADLLGDIKLATSEGSCPGDRVTGPAILWSFRLEQAQHPLCAVCCPHRDDPPIGFAQRLRRSHTHILPRAAPRAEAPDDLDCVLKRPASTNDGPRGQRPGGAPVLLLQILRRSKRKLEPQTRSGDEPEVLMLAARVRERLLKPMIGVLAIVERSDLSIAEAGIQTSSFDEVGAGIKTQHVQAAVSGGGLERLHETQPQSSATRRT